MSLQSYADTLAEIIEGNHALREWLDQQPDEESDYADAGDAQVVQTVHA